MAVYGISKEGADALKQLATDMSTLNNDIQECGQKLTAKVSGLGEGLGIYEEQILELIAGVNQTQEKGRESVELLTNKVKKMAADVEAMVSAGLAFSSNYAHAVSPQ